MEAGPRERPSAELDLELFAEDQFRTAQMRNHTRPSLKRPRDPVSGEKYWNARPKKCHLNVVVAHKHDIGFHWKRENGVLSYQFTQLSMHRENSPSFRRANLLCQSRLRSHC